MNEPKPPSAQEAREIARSLLVEMHGPSLSGVDTCDHRYCGVAKYVIAVTEEPS